MSYLLQVPANAPVRQYWSVTLYDFSTHALIRDVAWASRASNTPGLKQNADGSIDIYFGPNAPCWRRIQLGTYSIERQIRNDLPVLWP